MKNMIDKILPKYSYLPLLSVLAMNFITYNGTKIISNNLKHNNLAFYIDDKIPFLPIFIVIYILAFVQWTIGFIAIARENKKTCYKFLSAELIAKSICFIFFLVLPTTNTRPEILGNGVFEFLTKVIYYFDEPVNLFPSIHCLESWMCFRGGMHLNKVFKWYKWAMLSFSILVFLSTVFVKQHVVIDIVGGIICVEIGIWIARKFNTGRIFEKIESKIK